MQTQIHLLEQEKSTLKAFEVENKRKSDEAKRQADEEADNYKKTWEAQQNMLDVTRQIEILF